MLAVGDGAPGFWAALSKVFPSTKRQRCWIHKTANILNKLPKNQQPQAKQMLHEIWNSETREDALKAPDLFVRPIRRSTPKPSNAC
jgi:putative transposase